MRNNLMAIVTALLLATIGPVAHVDAATAEINLVQSALGAGSAEFDVEITFTGDSPGDSIDTLQLSVFNSSDALTDFGTDFSRFVFTPTFPDWETTFSIEDGLGSGLFGDPFLTSVLFDSPLAQKVGVLSVDLTGIPAGDVVTVSIDDDDEFVGTDVAGFVDPDVVFSFRSDIPGSIITQANGVAVTVPAGAGVPEPSSLLLATMAIGMVGARRRHRSIA